MTRLPAFPVASSASRSAGDLAVSAGAGGLLALWSVAGLCVDPLRRRLRTPDTEALAAAVDSKRILLTGASSGIGRDAALRLGGAGATVMIVARRAAELEAVAGEMQAAGGRAYAYPADLAEEAEIARLLALIDERHGGVDLLINNAGRSIRRSLADSAERPHDYERTMRINYFAALGLIRGVLPGMRARGAGHIINVATMGLQIRAPRFGAYLASKAALDAVSDCAAVETLGDGIDWTSVYMPLVRTPMIAPTRAYDAYPALPVSAATDMIVDAIVRRPRRVSTAVGDIGALARMLSPAVVERALLQELLLFPDRNHASGNGRQGDLRTTRMIRRAVRTVGPLAASVRR